MALNERVLYSNNQQPTSNAPQTGNRVFRAFVYGIILNDDPTTQASEIGAVRYSETKLDNTTNIEKLPIAYPLDTNYKTLPVFNEQVEIEIKDGSKYYKLIQRTENPSVTGGTSDIKGSGPTDNSGNSTPLKIDTKVLTTKTPKTNKDSSNELDGLGKYYTPQEHLHKLKLYEGDTVLESRFGQSIRLSGHNNPNNKLAPTIIIRNGETTYNFRKSGASVSVDEDINRDGSIIAMSSGENQLPFLPGVVDDNGNTNWSKTATPLSWTSKNSPFPQKLIGDQILINSGRIIISSKSAEMIFYSKKDYGFISEGTMHIDNDGGFNLNVGNKINLVSNGNDVNFYTDKGRINLGNTNLEPLVMGNKLVDILKKLIKLITEQKYLTPSGPTAIGPTNKPQFETLSSQLGEILSALNKTS